MRSVMHMYALSEEAGKYMEVHREAGKKHVLRVTVCKVKHILNGPEEIK